MNVGSPDTPVNAAASAGPAPRESNAAPAADSDTSAALFLDLLSQATAVAPPVTPGAVKTLVSDEATDATDDDAALNWALPLLAPMPPLTPPPADTEAQAAGDGDLLSLQEITATFAAARSPTFAPGSSKTTPDLLQLDGLSPPHLPDGADVAATMSAPRVEAASNGAVHAVVRHIPVPVTDGRWAEHVGHEVRILVERGIQGATLRLSPEHLGPVDVRIDIVNDKANVVFGAAQADTRAALTDAIPKLREMFAGAGLTLGDAGVRQEQPGQFHGSGPRSPGSGPGTFGEDVRDETDVVGRSVRLGLVDAYA
jgi:flagellar hook-length control protein FliK